MSLVLKSPRNLLCSCVLTICLLIRHMMTKWADSVPAPTLSESVASTYPQLSLLPFIRVNRITYWSQGVASLPHKCQPPYPPLDNIRVMVIVWTLRRNIIRTAPCWVVWHNVRSQQHTHMSSSYRSSRLGLSHWDPYAMHRSGCLELYYCNMVEWCWWDSSLICDASWFPSVLWHCWFGHMTCKNRPRYDL